MGGILERSGNILVFKSSQPVIDYQLCFATWCTGNDVRNKYITPAREEPPKSPLFYDRRRAASGWASRSAAQLWNLMVAVYG